MIMKDKIMKTNHCNFYYKRRRLYLTLSISVLCASIIAVPSYIYTSSFRNNKNISEAEREKKEESKEDKDNQNIIENKQ